MYGHAAKQPSSQVAKQPSSQAAKQTSSQADKQTNRQADKQTTGLGALQLACLSWRRKLWLPSPSGSRAYCLQGNAFSMLSAQQERQEWCQRGSLRNYRHRGTSVFQRNTAREPGKGVHSRISVIIRIYNLRVNHSRVHRMPRVMHVKH